MVDAPLPITQHPTPAVAGAPVRVPRKLGSPALAWAIVGSLALHAVFIGLAFVPARPQATPPPQQLLEVTLEQPAAKPRRGALPHARRLQSRPHPVPRLAYITVAPRPAPPHHPRVVSEHRIVSPRPALPQHAAVTVHPVSAPPPRQAPHTQPDDHSQSDAASPSPTLPAANASDDEPESDPTSADPNTAATALPDEDAGPLQTPNPPIPDALKGAEPYELLIPVTIEVDASGHVTQVTLNQSTGNSELDNALVAAWRATPFKPRRRNGQYEPATLTKYSRLQIDVKR